MSVRPPNFFIQDAVMSAIDITSNKPKSRMVNSIQWLKSRGRGMPINGLLHAKDVWIRKYLQIRGMQV